MTQIILIILLLLIAFTFGRRYGYAEGLRMGLATAAIDLRIAALKQGHCPICQHAEDDQIKNFPNSDGDVSLSKLGKCYQT